MSMLLSQFIPSSASPAVSTTDQGLNLGPLQWELGVLATRPPVRLDQWEWDNFESHLFYLKQLGLRQVTSLLWVSFSLFKGFPDISVGKESACSAGDPSSIPELGRFPGVGNVYPLQYSDLENSMDCIVYGVAKSRTRNISDKGLICRIYRELL